MTEFLERLKAAARFAGVGETQTEIAFSLGLNRQTVNRWFHGSEPSADQTFNIAQRYGVDPQWLKTGVGEIRPPTDGLASDERELVKNYRSATPQVRQVIRTMARAVRKSVVTVALAIPPLIAQKPADAATLHNLCASTIHIVKQLHAMMVRAVRLLTSQERLSAA